MENISLKQGPKY